MALWGGRGANVRRAAAPAQPRPSPSSATNFARTSGATPSEADAQRRERNSRPCMAFRIDAGHAGVGKTGGAPRLAIPVGRLGRHDAAFHYERSAVRVRQGSSVWEVWPNVDPAAIPGPMGSGPRLW